MNLSSMMRFNVREVQQLVLKEGNRYQATQAEAQALADNANVDPVMLISIADQTACCKNYG